MSTIRSHLPKPPRTVTEHNVVLCEIMGERDFKLLKAVYNLVVSAAILAMAILAILEGAEPTTIGGLAIAGVLVVNGFSVSEWLAVKAELNRRQQSQPEDDPGDG